MGDKLLLIVNPTSGKMRARNQLLEVIRIFCQASFSVSVHVTRWQGDAAQVVEKRGRDFDLLVACGGDGTFNEVVSGALKIGFSGAIGFLPCGTTNDLAQTLGIPKNLSKASLLITKTPPKDLDFGVFCGNRCFTYIASFGAFTDVAYSTDQNLKNVFGHAAYLAEGISRLKDLRAYSMKILCDGVEYEGDFLFGAVANALSIGGVMKLKKSSVDLRDGMHEVLLVKKPKNAAELASLSVDLIGGNFESKTILFFRGKEFEFRCSQAIPWCVDGEFAGQHEKAKIRNLHQKLQIIYP